MTPIGWGPALLIWAYALTWFLVNDVVKVMAGRLIRQTGTLTGMRGDSAGGRS